MPELVVFTAPGTAGAYEPGRESGVLRGSSVAEVIGLWVLDHKGDLGLTITAGREPAHPPKPPAPVPPTPAPVPLQEGLPAEHAGTGAKPAAPDAPDVSVKS